MSSRGKGTAIAVLVLSTVLFGAAIALRERVNPWWGNLGAALISAVAALTVIRGSVRSRLFDVRPRAIGVAVVVSVVMILGTHVIYGALASRFPQLESLVVRLYAEITVASPGIAVVVPLTAFVVIAEELVWRGVAFELLEGRHRGLVVLVSTVLYTAPQLIGQSPILIAAAVVAGGIFGAARALSGRLLEPLIIHASWSLAIFALIPLHSVR